MRGLCRHPIVIIRNARVSARLFSTARTGARPIHGALLLARL